MNEASRYPHDQGGHLTRHGLIGEIELSKVEQVPCANFPAIGVSGDDLSTYIARHQSGDWVDIDGQDWRENQLSLEQGFRLILVYNFSARLTIWVITEADTSSTTVLLPHKY
jgi:hypothetical protein